MDGPVRITDAQRRARLVARHHLARTAADPVAAVRGVVALHSSDPQTPYLATWARVPAFKTDDLEHALYDARTLWRLHAMRRTLFVVPTDEAPIFQAAASRDVAVRERRRITAWLDAESESGHDPGWLHGLERQTLELLGDGVQRRTGELGDALPGLATKITVGSGRWATRSRLASRLLFLLAMEGHLVRARPVGSWQSSQYHWARADLWSPDPRPRGEAFDAGAARAELARRYLAAFGPATLVDLRWWTGWTAQQSAAAVRALDAVTVELEDGRAGLVLPDDLDPPVRPPGHVSLLPGLDPTPMGWKQRDFYLGDHAETLFDRNGNVGPTVWVDGRIVGGWAQRPDGEVVYELLEDVGSDAADRVGDEAAALGRWLDGVVTTPRFRTPLEQRLTG